MSINTEQARDLKVLVSVLAKKVLPEDLSKSLIANLKGQPDVFTVVLAATEAFGQPDLKRSLNLAKPINSGNISLKPDFQGTQVSYQRQTIGQTKILFKSPLPGELQARLAIESTIDRFLEYLQKVHQIVVLDESDRHVRVFIPTQPISDFVTLWQSFISEVAFSVYGLPKHQLPGLTQTFISMLNSVTLSGRGFSTLDIPILNSGQAKILAALYFGVWRDAKKRQGDRTKKMVARQKEIEGLQEELETSDLSEKEFKSKEKELKSKTKQLEDAEAMQLKEAEKYQECFQKSFGKFLQEHSDAYAELEVIDTKLAQPGLSKADAKKLQKQQEKLSTGLILSLESTQRKLALLKQSEGDPFQFIEFDQDQHPEKFEGIVTIAKSFTKTATDQINGTRGDIFTQCISEMYRLMEMRDNQFESPPPPLLTEQPVFPEGRSPGDDSKEFCYSCGVALDPKTARWQVLRFMFERPSQRRQSASGEGRPHICSSCSALAFASPLKVTDESIILRLEPVDSQAEARMKLKDYLRMLTNKEMHLSAGKYIVLASDKTQTGDLASQKLGQVQYALAKVASIFPVEVLSDFRFSLMTQGGEAIHLAGRHLTFIKGLMTCYGQSIVMAGKDINMTLGDGVRYVQQDLLYLADYTLTKTATISNDLEMEKIRAAYWSAIQADLTLQGDSMDSDTQLSKRAKLYRDVASLTGLTWAFASSMENTLKAKDKDEREREISKLIEQVEDANFFCYYATLGVETTVQARLWKNSDNYFIYEQTKNLLGELGQADRESSDESGKIWLQLYADDVIRAYTHFAESSYGSEKEWKELTYQLKLSLYTRFPELVRKLKTTGDK